MTRTSTHCTVYTYLYVIHTIIHPLAHLPTERTIDGDGVNEEKRESKQYATVLFYYGLYKHDDDDNKNNKADSHLQM